MMAWFARHTCPAVLAWSCAVLFATGCSDGTHDPPCAGPPPLGPSFHLAIVARGGALPPGLTIRVHTGGGDEAFDLSHPCSPDALLVCYGAKVGDLCGDAAVRPPSRLSCNLWTDGTADVTVSGNGYPSTTQRLVPAPDECGNIKTSEAEIALDRGK